MVCQEKLDLLHKELGELFEESTCLREELEQRRDTSNYHLPLCVQCYPYKLSIQLGEFAVDALKRRHDEVIDRIAEIRREILKIAKEKMLK